MRREQIGNFSLIPPPTTPRLCPSQMPPPIREFQWFWRASGSPIYLFHSNPVGGERPARRSGWPAASPVLLIDVLLRW